MSVLLMLGWLGVVCLCGAGAAILSDYVNRRI
jgi:hypothetical protein